MTHSTREQIGNRTILITVVMNIFLSLIKLLAGFIGHSTSMISDGVHSLSDVISSIGVFIGLRISQKPADIDHPYGHEKFEAVLSKILAFILFLTGLSIGYSAIQTIVSSSYIIPKMMTIWAALLSIGVKEWMYHYTIRQAKKIESTALAADAWHHRSDSLSSIGALIGIIGARLGFPILDPLAALVITLIILKVAIEIFVEATNQVIDKAASPELVNEIIQQIQSVNGVLAIDSLKTRVHSNRIYVDLEISVEPTLSLIEAHTIAEAVHYQLEQNIHKIKHCTVHVNPLKLPSDPPCKYHHPHE
ncbi:MULTISPECIES: cation diffusion facilitator family transporter [Turicibacter]|uniref:cation diffusion facilitator family transporter n=1 Tax=Turicibacter TaxID=191303 RepID=UPI0007632AE2|nr:cation diffusion facilitator family transporter [Turicibacter sp. H121]AMC09250.1 cation diffusion facilitator family transporter [Turicibacter sp. H121]MCU7199506.1 cation diffusion facilitator family transporter [Turicibacter sp. H121]